MTNKQKNHTVLPKEPTTDTVIKDNCKMTREEAERKGEMLCEVFICSFSDAFADDITSDEKARRWDRAFCAIRGLGELHKTGLLPPWRHEKFYLELPKHSIDVLNKATEAKEQDHDDKRTN